MLPFFSFFGSKWRTVPHYPAPMHPLIIEPCAGSAGYATRHADRLVILCDRDPVICEVWRYLIRVSSAEIGRIPDVREHIDELAAWPQETRWLVGFWLNKGHTAPNLTPSAWMRSGKYPNQFWGAAMRARIAGQVDRIRHWKVIHGDYSSIPNYVATYFIDPPYSTPPGRRYKGGNKLPFTHLGDWCRSRQGFKIVCEQQGATWLPFQPFRRIHTNAARTFSDEVVWIEGGAADEADL